MPRIETTILDRFINGAFVGKRKIGRPLKYNIRHKGHQGWIELVFNPKTKVESYVSEALRFIHPYLFYVTYRFHVEKAREAGKSPDNCKLFPAGTRNPERPGMTKEVVQWVVRRGGVTADLWALGSAAKLYG
jgi:hypothetical protein